MKRSDKNALFLRLARPYVAGRLRRAFAGVRVAGLERFRAELARGPALVAPNHVAWWDPLWLVHLDRYVGGGGHCLMDAENLERHGFFRWAGAIPLDRSSGRRALADLERAGALLEFPGDYVVVFPEGRQNPPHLALHFQSGVDYLARSTGCPVVPVGVRYDFLEGPLPWIHVSFGPALVRAPTERGFVTRLARAVRSELDAIDRVIASEARVHDEFVELLDQEKPRDLPRGARLLGAIARGRAS